ncbi:hypothetical protein [Microlunatus sp. Gsoil 973]|uniref:hypothetical protein n=1 Tax=Microlunatus sp. Gsoil 973 TaxID=2672569 RepID=UPI0012B4C565|nr:hypothetical protein [Microlunatus sp. Gsoil 973]QGN31828.1 hypothetical protein GJV80_02245 [Microlunatus sp. Gsoil 973]
MRRSIAMLATAVACLFAFAGTAKADPPGPRLSGAIFTSDVSGVPVNLNQYGAKDDVYLNGGPGINAPDDAAGLPAGTYTFQVTDPSGKTLLSTDDISCRQFTVDASGVIQNVSAAGSCAHSTGTDGEDFGITVQLFPYNDTPNPGGVYKVWVTPTDQLDCKAAGNKHCFVPRYSKTDNFKVKNNVPVEIDTTFSKPGISGYIDGLGVIWTDTLGASNAKYSEYNPSILAFHEAHVEATEPGTHKIAITDQPGCTIASVLGPDGKNYRPNKGAVTVSVTVSKDVVHEATYFLRVTCAS